MHACTSHFQTSSFTLRAVCSAQCVAIMTIIVDIFHFILWHRLHFSLAVCLKTAFAISSDSMMHTQTCTDTTKGRLKTKKLQTIVQKVCIYHYYYLPQSHSTCTTYTHMYTNEQKRNMKHLFGAFGIGYRVEIYLKSLCDWRHHKIYWCPYIKQHMHKQQQQKCHWVGCMSTRFFEYLHLWDRALAPSFIWFYIAEIYSHFSSTFGLGTVEKGFFQSGFGFLLSWITVFSWAWVVCGAINFITLSLFLFHFI